MAFITFQPSDYFNTKLYSGNGTTNTAQTSVGFQPDWIWIKERSSTSSHIITDAVRGANKSLSSNLTSAESTETQSLISFDSDGFTVGSGGGVNESSQTYASWNWRASGTSGSSNSDGTITSTVSANTTSGFSIVKYVGNGSVGATVGHGLSATPKIVFFKDLDATRGWNVIAPTILGNGYYLVLNGTDSSASYNSSWTTNSTQIVLADGGGHNASGNNYIAYCFAEKKGYSKFGSYTGNGNADGPFIYTGFKPAWIMFKRTDSTQSWNILDNKRSPINDVDKYINAESNSAEDTFSFGDFTSNGIKLRNTGVSVNASGGSYIYMAFAEEPLVSSNNIPATAR
jgi:hypothetical protein